MIGITVSTDDTDTLSYHKFIYEDATGMEPRRVAVMMHRQGAATLR